MKKIRQYYIAKASNIAYLKIPKCACTSIKIAISKMRFGPQLQEAKSVHHAGNYPILFGGVVRDYDPVLDGIFKFTFVRDPVQRVFSFYKNKILDFDSSVSPHYYRLGIKKTDSFNDFVDKLIRLDFSQLEEHLMPQSFFCFDDGVLKVDYIGKMETISDDWKIIEDISGFKILLTVTNKTNKVEKKLEINEESKNKLINYYQEDCNNFGYHNGLEQSVVEGLKKQVDNYKCLEYSNLSNENRFRMQNQLIENLQINLSQLKEQVAFSNNALKTIQDKLNIKRDSAWSFNKYFTKFFYKN